MTTYPQPTTDADEFVAGMEAAHKGATSDAKLRPFMLIDSPGENRVYVTGGSYTATEARVLAERLVDAAETVERERANRAHFEVLNEAMDWDPQP